jgi:CheY-like chemotaxis protein
MNTAGPVILLVEDDRNDVFFVRRAFQKAAVSTVLHVASDGQEAMDYIAGHGRFADRNQFPRPSLVLLDLKMPHVDGFELLEWLQSQPGFNHLPRIVLTSSPIDRDRQRAEELGATRYLVKPPTPEMVAELILLLNAVPTAA